MRVSSPNPPLPNRKLTLRFVLIPSSGPTYQLRYGAKPVIQPSWLAVLLKDAPGFAQCWVLT